MSLENFKNKKIEWDTVNKNFDQSVQIISGDVNSRTVTIVITDNGQPIDLTGYSVKLIYKYIYNDISGFVMLTPIDAKKGEFSLTIPTEMTVPGSIKSNLILLNESLEQVIVSKNLKFISDDSTVTDLAQEVNNKIDDFTKLLLENMPQVMRSELNDLHAQTESNTSNIELKANLADMTSLQSAMTDLKNEVEAFGISPENLITIKSLLDAIANSATDSEVAELINSVNILTSNISLMSNGDYSPKANQTDLESLQATINNQSATISSKANQTDLDNLQTTVTNQGVAISTKAEQADLLITNQNVTTAQTTANQAKTDAQTAITKATEAQANSLPLNGNAVSASKLATARKLGVSLQSLAYQNFDGTADVTNIGVSGVLPIANGGTGNIGGYAYGLNCNTNTTDFSAGLKIYTKGVNTSQSNMFILQSAWAENAPISGVYIVICSITSSSANGNMSMTALANGTIYSATVPYIYTAQTINTQSTYTTTATPNWVKVLNASGKGTDYAAPHPVGSVVSNNSNLSSGYMTGTWENIGSAVIGSTTIYYWKRTA